MRYYFSLLLLLIACRLHAQRAEWIVLNDCKSVMNVQRICPDKVGNVYVIGDFQDSTVFRSALNDTSINRYVDGRKVFLSRYNTVGQLDFVVEFKASGSNASLGVVQVLDVLPTGECVVALQCVTDLDFIDVNGETHFMGKNGMGDNLFCIRPDGSMKWSKSMPLGWVSLMDIADDGTIYMFGAIGRGPAVPGSKCLLSFTSDGVQKDSTTFKHDELKSMCVNGKYLYLGVAPSSVFSGYWSNSKAAPAFPVGENNFALYRMHRRTGKKEKLYEVKCPMTNSNGKDHIANFDVALNADGKIVLTDFLLMTQYLPAQFMGSDYARTGLARTNNTHIVRLNMKGEVINTKSFISERQFAKLMSLTDGSSALIVAAPGTAFYYGNDSLVLPKNQQYVTEMVVMKIDPDLNRVWWFTAGPVLNTFKATLVPTKKDFFLAVNLTSTVTVLGIKQEMLQASGMYLVHFME